MKFHFITEVLTALIILLIVMNDNMQHRALLMIPALALFHATLLIFGFEYDKMNAKQWKTREKRIIEKMSKKK